MVSQKKKICFLAPTGYGKSTAAKYLAKKLNGEIHKLAKPLYEMQDGFYEKIGKKVPEGQDGELLQFLGLKTQKSSPEFLAKEFGKEINKSKSLLILNDDCRPHNFKYLKKMGFIFVEIKGHSRVRKEDITSIDPRHEVEWLPENIKGDYIIKNNKDLKSFYLQLDKLAKEII